MTTPRVQPPERAVREYKTLAFQAGDTTGLEENEFCGYVAAFSNLDGTGDVIAPGAFSETLPSFLADGAICWQHDWATPIGKPLEAREDAYGLFLKARISLTSAGKDALILLRDGVVTKMSIGYEVLGYRMLSDTEGVAMFGQVAYDAAMRDLPWYQDQIRVLTAIKLYEGSPVTVPANPKAIITGVKDGSLLAGLPHDAHFEAVHAAVAEYLIRVKALKALRAKSGRMLSAANAGKLQTMRDSLAEHMKTIEDLLAANDPDSDGDDDDPEGTPDPTDSGDKALRGAITREFLRYQQWTAAQQGVA